ncbi:MAG: OmpA family protein [Campylobacteraceae bacterium]|jgi:OOP family OmpA-OmpF porin|nr:OmpA family protein [Campylobacteraceae bacterium]
MKRVFFIIISLGFTLMAVEGRYEITPTISGVFPEGNTDLKDQLSVGLRVGQYFDNEFINKVESGIEFTKTYYEDMGPGTGKRQALITRYFAHGIKEFGITENAYFYALAGIGYENIRKKTRYGNNDSPYGNYGVGFRYAFTDNFYLRTEVRHAIKLHNGHGDNNLFATLGVSYALKEKSKEDSLSTDVLKNKLTEEENIVVEVVEANEQAIEKNDSAQQTEYIPAQTAQIAEEPDSDNDGVFDDDDLCPNTPAEFKVDSVGCIKSITLKINFASNKADIADKFKPQIKSVAEILQNERDYKVILEGHTDSTGSKDLNLKLSEQRAKSVAEELIRLGVDKERIITEWFGSEKPIASNKNIEGRAENRRIEAIFIK